MEKSQQKFQSKVRTLTSHEDNSTKHVYEWAIISHRKQEGSKRGHLPATVASKVKATRKRPVLWSSGSTLRVSFFTLTSFLMVTALWWSTYGGAGGGAPYGEYLPPSAYPGWWTGYSTWGALPLPPCWWSNGAGRGTGIVGGGGG